ncbi:MAG: acyl-CoA reductase, partial [Candidatus Methylomirabilales bacterium]
MIVPGYFLLDPLKAVEVTSLNFGRVQVQVPVLTPAFLGEVIGTLTEARDRYLARLPIPGILEVVDRAIARWLDPGYPPRKLAEAALPEVTGFSPPMVASTLPKMLEGYRGDRLWKLLESELGDPLALDGFRPYAGGYSRAFGPRLVTHVFSGNIPFLAAPGLILTLLAKSASLAKASSEEPIFPALFARSLAEEDPRL